MRIRILPSAKRDLHRGFRLYERQENGIGSYFLDSLYSDIDSICLFAGIHRRVGELFRFKSKRFPFWVYYRVEVDTAYVVAVLDARQAPWKVRRRERINQRVERTATRRLVFDMTEFTSSIGESLSARSVAAAHSGRSLKGVCSAAGSW